MTYQGFERPILHSASGDTMRFLVPTDPLTVVTVARPAGGPPRATVAIMSQRWSPNSDIAYEGAVFLEVAADVPVTPETVSTTMALHPDTIQQIATAALERMQNARGI